MDESKIQNKLTSEQVRVMRDKGTEAPHTGEHLYCDNNGIYACAACGNQLFDSTTKFDSHCGWPNFSDVLGSDAVELGSDGRYDMERIEVSCRNCHGHLGHVFEDSPEQPTGLRYCINSVSLNFSPKK